MTLSARRAMEERERKRLRELSLCQTNLFYLCNDVLGYEWNPAAQNGMTREFHLPMCERMDSLREHPRVANFWPRWHLKTTILTIGLAIQEILRNPDITILVCHAVDEEVEKMISEIVNHFRTNERLRALRPEIMPARNAVRWYKTNQFTVKRDRFSRQPTVLGRGAGAEITGAHVDLILLDDIIGRRTIEDSALPKIASWYRNTVVPVLNPGGRIRVVGTRWHTDDIYGTFLDSRDWNCMVRAALEVDGQADYKGAPVLYGPPGDQKTALARMELLRSDMGPDFAPQMMNDPSPAGEKPWDRAKCEHFISWNEAKVGGGFVCVLGDPAPAKTGAFDGRGSKLRADGSKDPWVWCVVKIRRNRMRQEIVLLDVRSSREWDVETGFAEGCRLQRRWGAAHVAIEATGQAIALYHETHRRVARREGVPHNPITLTATYKGKNHQFANLTSRAMNDELLICTETVPEAELDVLLQQCRDWRPMMDGKNGLRYDDHANCLSFACDPGLADYAPSPEIPDLWVDESENEPTEWRSRYCVA